jgi:predicted nucleotidyltransferase
MTTETGNIQDDRVRYSRERLEQLTNRLGELEELTTFPGLTVFGAGSYARLEASEYSDIDMFFLSRGGKNDVPELRTRSLRMFGKVIDTVTSLGFPPFSNDSEYLVILHTDEILDALGSRTDDHENYFTARMLLLLESHCLYGQDVYDEVMQRIIQSYFTDYPDHAQTFQPIFLMNDICRFWKTLLLNYENRRKTASGANQEEIERRRTKQKVRNFKLKYSRMTTCFATIAALGCRQAPVTEEQVFELTKLTPHERLDSVKTWIPDTTRLIDDLLHSYSWFLEMTGLPTAQLEEHFSDKQRRVEMFRNANEYGDAMFKLLQAIDASAPNLRLLRTLVI